MSRLRQLKSLLSITFKLVRLAVVILLVLITTVVGVGAVLWKFQSDFLSRYISSTVTREVLRPGYRLSVGDILGSPFESVSLRDVVVEAPARDTVLAIDEIRFRYPPIWGFRRELSLESLTISGAEVQLEEQEGGGLALPWRAPARRTSPLEPRPANRVEQLNLVDVDVRLVTAARDTVRIAEDFYLDGTLRVDGETADLQVSGAAGEVPVALLDVDWLRFDARLTEGRIEFSDVTADVGGSHAEGRGVVAIVGPTYYQFDVDTAHVETADAYEAIDLADVLGHGHVTGHFRVEKAPLGVYLGWDVTGRLNEDPIDHLEGRVQITNEDVLVDGLLLESLGARVAGEVSLEVASPRRYHAEVLARNLDLSDVPIHDELVPLHAHRLNGRVTIIGRDYELDFPDMSVRASAGPSEYLGVPIDTLDVTLELVPGDSVLITDAVARAGGGMAHATGYIVADESCSLDVHALGLPLERLAALHGREDLRGVGGFAGRIFGDVEHPRFSGTGAVADVSLTGVALDVADVDSISGVLVPFSAEVAARAAGVRIAEWRADSLELDATLADTIRVHGLRAEAPDSVLTASGWVRVTGDGAAEGRVDALSLDVPVGEIVLREAAPFRRDAAGRVDAGPAAFAFAGGEVDLEVSTEEEGTRPRTSLATRGIALFDLIDPHVDAVSLGGGRAAVDLVYLADPLRPELSGTARLDTLTVGDVRVDGAAFTFDGGSDTLRVREADVRLGGGRVAGELMLAGAGSVVRDLLASSPVDSLARVHRRLDARIVADDVEMGLAGRIAELANPDAVDTSRVTRLLYTRDRDAVKDLWHALDGEADIELSASGTLDRPELRLRFSSDSLVVRGQQVESVRVASVYGDSLLTISQGEIVAGDHTTQISGFVPVVVNLATRRAHVVDDEMLVALDMPETPLSLAGVIFPDLVVISGTVTGAGTLQGTPEVPSLEGRFTVKDGELRLRGRTEWVWDAKGTISLTNHAVVVNDFTAREGSKGRIRANGNWSRTDDYRFQITVRDFTVSQDGMIGVVDATLNMSPDERTAGRLLPRFDGIVRVKNGEIFQWPEEKPEQTAGQIDALYDLTVDIARVNVNTNELQTTTNAVIGDGELTVRNYPETLRLGGLLSVLEGGGTVYGNQFRVRRGELNFLEVDGVNPQLDIVAETRIRGAYARQRGITASSPKIVATITGTLKEPVVTLTTEPTDLGLSQTEIFEYLTIGRFASDDATTGLEPTAEILLGLIAQDIARALPYVDHVEVTTSEESPSISFVKSLSDEWTIGYTTGVSSSPDQEISIEARLSRILVLKGGVIREEIGTSGDPGGRYNLDLRLDFEY